MAKQPKNKIDYSKIYADDIRAMNNARKAEGFKLLPIRNTDWYDKLIKFCNKRYSNSEFAIKAIGLQLSTYQATKLQKDKSYITRLDSIVKKETFWGTSLDVVIRSGNIEKYGSDTINKLADRDETDAIRAFKSGQRDWQDYLKNGNVKAI